MSAIKLGAASTLLPLFKTASPVGFGAVIAALAGSRSSGRGLRPPPAAA
jgi:hypothetical protein